MHSHILHNVYTVGIPASLGTCSLTTQMFFFFGCDSISWLCSNHLLLLPPPSTGIAGSDKCPYRNNALIGYLIGGGFLLGITVLFRSIPSIATIGKNHNWCRSRQSSACSGCICALEVVFYVLLALNVIAIILGSFWAFDGKPSFDCSDEHCCSKGVYGGTIIFLIIQYVLYIITPIYMCITVSCNHCLRAQELE